jgi:hypothetical protein
MSSLRLCVLLALLSPLVHAMEPAQGFCEKGGITLMTGGKPGSPKIQGSYPSCTVTVYLNGTMTLATIFSDNSSTPLSNPFTANTIGIWEFYAANGRYDVRLSNANIGTPFLILRDVVLSDSGGGGGGTPGGISGQIQYNNSGSFGGITGATTNGTAVTLTSPTFITPALGTPASGVGTNLTGIPPAAVTSAQGNGSKFQLSTGSTTTNDCVKFDANGNTVDAGGACGGAASNAFSALTTSTNTTATMTVGSGASLVRSGTGIVDANQLLSTVITGITGMVKMTSGVPSAGTSGTDYVGPTTATTYTAGAKQTFSQSGTTAGLNLGILTADPSGPAQGDVWYNSGAVLFRDASATRTFATLDGSQTLSNKTLTTPTIGSFVNATHGHTNAAGGGQLTATTALSATGTPSVTTFLRGDNSWATPGGSGGCTPGGSAGQLLSDTGSGGCASSADFSISSHTLQSGASGILDLHASGTSGFFVPGGYTTGLLHVTTTTGAVAGGLLVNADITNNTIDISAKVTGNLAVSHLNSGTGATSSTFWRGDGTWASPAGSGTVTVVGSGTLTNTALVTGGGAQTVQTPSATSTLDSSGNEILAGTLTTGNGSGIAGADDMINGTVAAVPSNSFGWGVGTTMTTSVRLQTPNAVPLANNVMLFGAPSSNIATWTWTGISGTGSFCMTTSCAMVTPALGTPSAIVLTNATGLPAGALPVAIRRRAIPFSIGDPQNSAALTTSSVSAVITVPFACTISGYSLQFGVGDSGTITVKFWKVASGTAIPTISNVINTSGVGIASGTAIQSSTVTDFTTTTVSANDMIGMVVTAVATAKSITGQLQCDQ